MDGSRITFRNLVVWCGESTHVFGDGINSAAFVNASGAGDTTPTDVVVEHAVMAPGSANGVSSRCVRSGIRDSVACPDWTPTGGPVLLGSDAVDGIDVGKEKPLWEDLRCSSLEAALAWAQAPP